MSITAEAIRESWGNTEGRIGFSRARDIAEELQSTVIPRPFESSILARHIHRFPTEPFLYPGAMETVDTIVKGGDNVVIWTQGDLEGQTWKVATSGITKIRHEANSPEERKKLSIFTAEQKIPLLGNLIRSYDSSGVTIVDDKSDNIVKIEEEILRLKASGELDQDFEVRVVWINQGRTRDQVPENYTLDDFKTKFSTINDISELDQFRKVIEDGTLPHLWLIDWDHTLANTGEWKKSLAEDVANTFNCEDDCIVDPLTDRYTGLNGYKVEEIYTNGMSNVTTARIVEPERGHKMVVKHAALPSTKEKIVEEVDGHSLLKGTPLEPYILPLDTRFRSKGIITTPYFEGIQMREGLRTGELDFTTAQRALAELIEVKLRWWSQQKNEGVNTEAPRKSMQRREWPDTIQRITEEIIPSLAAKSGVSIEELINTSLVYEGQQFHTIGSMISQVDRFLANEYTDLSVITHGDATGANIVLNPQSGVWKLVDYQWAGLNDPAESYVRMIKQISSALLPAGFHSSLTIDRDRTTIEYGHDMPERSSALQEYGMSLLPQIEAVLNDPTFSQRVEMYMSGSYLREAALSIKRGNLDFAVFALVQAENYLLNK